jgi:hypothetical protein
LGSVRSTLPNPPSSPELLRRYVINFKILEAPNRENWYSQ